MRLMDWNIEWMNKFVKNCNIKELTRELLSSLVEKIYVGVDKNIHIQFKYQDEYSRIINYIKSHIQEERVGYSNAEQSSKAN